jgi:hypothetical protein
MNTPRIFLVETCNVPRNGQATFKAWIQRSTVESAERTRAAFPDVSLAIVEIVDDFVYHVS